LRVEKSEEEEEERREKRERERETLFEEVRQRVVRRPLSTSTGLINLELSLRSSLIQRLIAYN